MKGKELKYANGQMRDGKLTWAPPVTEAVFMKSMERLRMSLPYWSDQEDKPAYIRAMKSDIEAFIQQLKTPAEL